MYSVASVVNYLMMKLGRLAFSPPTSKHREHWLVGIFHSVTQDKYKERIVNSLKTSGSKKIVVATSALSMGVNFPNIKFIVMYGLGMARLCSATFEQLFTFRATFFSWSNMKQLSRI